jgi:hypothetical protein
MFARCTQLRRMKITHTSTTFAFGVGNPTDTTEWVTRECGQPALVVNGRTAHWCRACREGWTHPENYPVDTADFAVEPMRTQPNDECPDNPYWEECAEADAEVFSVFKIEDDSQNWCEDFDTRKQAEAYVRSLRGNVEP